MQTRMLTAPPRTVFDEPHVHESEHPRDSRAWEHEARNIEAVLSAIGAALAAINEALAHDEDVFAVMDVTLALIHGAMVLIDAPLAQIDAALARLLSLIVHAWTHHGHGFGGNGRRLLFSSLFLK